MTRVFANNPYGRNFLGNAPEWYKLTILLFLVLNPLFIFTLGSYAAGWILVGEFIFCLAMALKCYPLQPGGLLALQAVFLNMTTPATVYHEVEAALEVILLLVFMVAGIYFMKDMLLYLFTKILVKVRSKLILSLLFSSVAAVLSAFLDALTVTAVIITIGVGSPFTIRSPQARSSTTNTTITTTSRCITPGAPIWSSSDRSCAA